MSVVGSLTRLISLRSLRSLDTCFCSRDSRLISWLENLGFNQTLVEHPEILFSGRRIEKKHHVPALVIRLGLLAIKKAVKNDSLNCPKGNAALLAMGINPFWGSVVKNFLQETAIPRIDYNIPISDGQYLRRVVYSVNTGKYDTPRELLFKNPEVDYLMFTNNPELKSETWTVILVNSDLDNVLLSRDIKMSPHKYLPKEYSESVYIDANATIFGDISQLCNFLSDDVSLAVTKHSLAGSVAEEIDRCVEIKGIDKASAYAQYEKYLGWGFDDKLGLAECTILIRRHNEEKLVSLMEEWWEEFSTGIRRDQISLLPCIVHQSFHSFRLIDGCVWNNQFCVIGWYHKR